MTSRVPQGSILGPMLFLLVANDLPDAVASCKVRTFPDDTKVYKVINSSENVINLQRDLDNLGVWADKSDMLFNQKKSKIVRVRASAIQL